MYGKSFPFVFSFLKERYAGVAAVHLSAEIAVSAMVFRLSCKGTQVLDLSDLSPVTGCGRQSRSYVDRRDIE
jgi:hypothetical protein